MIKALCIFWKHSLFIVGITEVELN